MSVLTESQWKEKTQEVEESLRDASCGPQILRDEELRGERLRIGG